jgi:hypothetical protein
MIRPFTGVVTRCVQLAAVLTIAAPALAAAAGGAENPFTLTRGDGIPVCEAYLTRLNAATYQKPPYCDRPENAAVEGFELLNRVPLNSEQVYELSGPIGRFTWYGDQDSHPSQGPGLSRESVERDLGRTIRVWRYEPPVDLDNDGTPESVVIWQGYGASKGDYPCGSVKERYPRGQPQIAYVVDLDARRVDQQRTRELFGHPVGGYPIPRDVKPGGFFPGFRPVGSSMGIFKYRGLYYFDTFFDSWGDFAGRRRKDPHIGSTLGVFLREGGKTKQVCEYLWHEEESRARRQ